MLAVGMLEACILVVGALEVGPFEVGVLGTDVIW